VIESGRVVPYTVGTTVCMLLSLWNA